MRGREPLGPWRTLCFVVLAFLLGGCGQIQPPPPGEAPPWETPRPSPTPPPADRVRLLASWRGGDESGFLRALETFTARTGIVVDYTGEAEVADALLAAIEAGTPPDVVILPKPNWLWELASAGAIPPLPPDVAMAVRQEYAAAWVELVSYEGELYGVPVRAASKSLLWYRPDAFARPPTLSSLEDLETTARALAARNVRPFALPAGEGGGWPLTDWFENILLAERGPKTYEALARHDIPWTHPDVRRATVRFTSLLRDEWVLEGIQGALELALAESFEATFTPAEPRAAFWLGLGPVVEGQRRKFPALRPGEVISVTAFPANGVVGVADVAVALNGREATRRLMAFLVSAEMARIWIAHGGYFISPNGAVPPADYGDPFRAYEARQLQEAEAFAYDLSDRVPRLLAQELQRGLRTLLLAPENVDAVLAQIEEVAGQEQGFR